MNKAKEKIEQMTRETMGYLCESNLSCDAIRKEGVNIDTCESIIPDKISIKRAIPRQYFQNESEHYFAQL